MMQNGEIYKNFIKFAADLHKLSEGRGRGKWSVLCAFRFSLNCNSKCHKKQSNAKAHINVFYALSLSFIGASKCLKSQRRKEAKAAKTVESQSQAKAKELSPPSLGKSFRTDVNVLRNLCKRFTHKIARHWSSNAAIQISDGSMRW